jgi:hypothetical protein
MACTHLLCSILKVACDKDQSSFITKNNMALALVPNLGVAAKSNLAGCSL